MAKKAKTKYKLMVIAGHHRISKQVSTGPSGEPILTGKNISRGGIFESDKELHKMYPEKFVEAPSESTPSTVDSDGDNALTPPNEGNVPDGVLDMTLAELKDFANLNQIDLGDATLKDEVLEKIISAKSVPSV